MRCLSLRRGEGAVWCRAPSQCGFQLRIGATEQSSLILRVRWARRGSPELKEYPGRRER